MKLSNDPEGWRIFDTFTRGRVVRGENPSADKLLAPFRLHLDEITVGGGTRNTETVDGLFIDVVDDLTLNAVAFTQGNREFVGIHAGLALFLPCLTSHLLAQPEFLPTIGNPSIERPQIRHLPRAFLGMNGRLTDIPDPTGIFPSFDQCECPHRRNFAFLMAALGWTFLINHEMAHIVRNHLRFLRQGGFTVATAAGVVAHHEFNACQTPEEANVRHILEVDADTTAAQIQVGGYDHTVPGKLAAWLGEDPAKWGWEREFFVWQIAIRVLFEAMAMLDPSAIDDSKGTHPHPDVRMNLVLNLIAPRWAKFIPDQGRYNALCLENAELFTGIAAFLPIARSRLVPGYIARRRHETQRLYHVWEPVATGPLNELTKERLRARKLPV